MPFPSIPPFIPRDFIHSFPSYKTHTYLSSLLFNRVWCRGLFFIDLVPNICDHSETEKSSSVLIKILSTQLPCTYKCADKRHLRIMFVRFETKEDNYRHIHLFRNILFQISFRNTFSTVDPLVVDATLLPGL